MLGFIKINEVKKFAFPTLETNLEGKRSQASSQSLAIEYREAKPDRMYINQYRVLFLVSISSFKDGRTIICSHDICLLILAPSPPQDAPKKATLLPESSREACFVMTTILKWRELGGGGV